MYICTKNHVPNHVLRTCVQFENCEQKFITSLIVSRSFYSHRLRKKVRLCESSHLVSPAIIKAYVANVFSYTTDLSDTTSLYSPSRILSILIVSIISVGR